MNNLEERIYRDATRTAAQVTDADIPPLRLARRGRRASGRDFAGQPTMAWSGTRRGTAARRILIPLAAAASVAALISVLIVVGHGSPGTPKHVRPPVAPTKRATAGNRLLATEALDWYFPDSGASYTEGLAFAFTQAKITARDIDPCLAQAGFPQPAFNGSQRQYQLAFADDSQFPDLAQLAANPGDHYFTKQYLVLRHPTAARQKAIDRAQARCTARYAQPVTRVDKAASALQGTWLTIISAIEHTPAVNATQPPFARCLERHGVPASFATQTDNSASNPLFYGLNAWADSTNQAATTAAQAAADQRHEARVFLACAPRVVSVLERIQIARRTHFFHQHAAQIARIARLAQEMSGHGH